MSKKSTKSQSSNLHFKHSNEVSGMHKLAVNPNKCYNPETIQKLTNTTKKGYINDSGANQKDILNQNNSANKRHSLEGSTNLYAFSHNVESKNTRNSKITRLSKISEPVIEKNENNIRFEKYQTNSNKMSAIFQKDNSAICEPSEIQMDQNINNFKNRRMNSGMINNKLLAVQINDDFSYIDFVEKIDDALTQYLDDVNLFKRAINQISSKYINFNRKEYKNFLKFPLIKASKKCYRIGNFKTNSLKSIDSDIDFIKNEHSRTIKTNNDMIGCITTKNLNPQLKSSRKKDSRSNTKDDNIIIGSTIYSPANKFYQGKSLKAFKHKYQLMIKFKNENRKFTKLSYFNNYANDKQNLKSKALITPNNFILKNVRNKTNVLGEKYYDNVDK